MALSEQDFTFFGKNSEFQGVFKLMGTTHLASIVEGEILMSGDHKLFIERDGKITGKITCKNLDIHGEFNGIVESEGIVTIFPSAKITGKIQSKNLVVFPGAFVEIECHTGH